jgi:acyl-coenzyme A synthetase/AMP-(fatty) acid ligase
MEKNKLFVSDRKWGLEASYDSLFEVLNREEVNFYPYCKTNDLFRLFSDIVVSMVHAKEVALLDSDFSDDEIRTLLGEKAADIGKEMILRNDPRFSSHADLIRAIRQRASNWRITLLTSGTTGIPKIVSHSLKSISRWVKEGEKYRDYIWGFAYNPTHMAGVQVFFQAFFNMNPMINLFGYTSQEIHDLVSDYAITNISATPTWYRMLFPCNKNFNTVRHVTMGGEKYDQKLAEKLQEIFPMAKMHNIYASTEAGALFSSDGEIFTLREEFKDIVKIRDGELCIRKDVLGQANFDIDDRGWYGTGDMVEIIEENPLRFKFRFRNNELISIGGYKVNPHEVEEVLMGSGMVKDACVYGKRNSVMGNILCCDIVLIRGDTKEKDLKQYLTTRLQGFKVPRIIKFVNQLATTKSGKLKRL